MKKKTSKITKMEPRDDTMQANSHGATTYGEWCKAEQKRIGNDAVYVEEPRVIRNGLSVKVPETTPGALMFCRLDRA